MEECARGVLLRTLGDVRRRRDPHSPAWREGIPLFVGGGGSQSPLVQAFVNRADQIAKGCWDPFKGVERRELPVPEALAPQSALSAAEYLRLAVAFGLSFPALDIGVIEPPDATPDIRIDEQRRDWQRAYVDKDQV